MGTKDGAFELGTSGLQAAIDAAREALPTAASTDKLAVVAPNALSLRHQLKNGLIAVGHALWWIGALEDWHRDRLGDRSYFDIRPEIVGGLRYVRNLVAQQLARTIQIGEIHGTLRRFDGEGWAPVTLADMLEAPSETAAAVTVEVARWVRLQELPDDRPT